MASSVKFKFDKKINTSVCSAIEQKRLDALRDTVREMNAAVKKDQYMPYDTGSMQNHHTAVRKSGARRVTITTRRPYARRLYFHPEFNFQTTHNANAGAYWWDRWISEKGGGGWFTKTYAKIYRNGRQAYQAEMKEQENGTKGGNE